MDGMNRAFIAILLLAVLFALYKYQEHIAKKSTTRKRKKPRRALQQQAQPEYTYQDDVSLSGLSQLSVGDLEDIRSIESQQLHYKPDSELGSIGGESQGGFSFLSDGSGSMDSDEFFQ